MGENTAFKPEWLSPPGDTITDLAKQRGVKLSVLKETFDYYHVDVNNLINGRERITKEIASELSKILGASEKFWIKRDLQYITDLERLYSSLDTELIDNWLKELPVRDMIAYGWLPEVNSHKDQILSCLAFFGISSTAQWKNIYFSVFSKTSFRTSPSYQSTCGAISAWLRKGELASIKQDIREWNPQQFQESLQEIKALTREKNPESFVPKLQDMCAKCGVSVVVVRAPKDCKASGAARRLKNGTRQIMLSFRFLSDDHFWFTFP